MTKKSVTTMLQKYIAIYFETKKKADAIYNQDLN